MNKHLCFATAIIMSLSCMQHASAQNTPPYWSLAGNNNATPSSKLGTTNNISLRFYTKNQQRMIINSEQGWVGIGTTAPTERLHVNSVAGANAFRVQVNGSTKLLVHSGGGVSVGSFSPPPTNGLYVSGNVGIGTPSPSQKLHVAGKGLFTTGLIVNNGGIQATNTEAGSAGIHGSGDLIGVSGSGSLWAVLGTSDDGVGVSGQSNSFTGVSGLSYDGTGVAGESGSSDGVFGISQSGFGVNGYSASGHGGNFESENAWGIRARTINGTYAGVFYGQVWASGGYITSDKSLKQNVRDFNGAMNLINKLKPRYYEFKTDSRYAFLNLDKGSQYGLLAQDVEEVLPNLVSTADHEVLKPVAHQFTKRNADGTIASAVPKPQATADKPETVSLKAVNYTGLIPIMIKGMQEQAELIKQQQQQINELRDQIARLKDNGVTTISSSALGVATPNPARNSTRISYNLPAANSSGQLLLTDAAGKTVKAISLNRSGYVDLNTAGLSNGVYTYSLLVDGKFVASGKLQIAKN